ncbi:MAG: hypothetical protein ACJ74H_21830 [Thermoanaerobaculia bacterium]
MRKLLSLVALAAVVGFGCQPKVLILNVSPASVVNGPATVKVNWKLSAGTAEISSDKPVKPVLVPKKGIGEQGTLEFEVCETTTFKVEPHYGGERTTTVTVAKPCGTECGNRVLTFTGTCVSSSQGPAYITQNVPNFVTGNVKDLFSDADVPIHVFHAGLEVALGASGGPVFPPVPPMPAAGDYTITMPGAPGMKVCEDAIGPTGGGTVEAPVVHITVIPACAK